MDSVIERPQLNEAIAAGLQTFPAIVQRLYHHRGIASLDQVNHAMKGLASYHALKGMDAATVRIAEAIKNQQHIVIVGDYDADGATSTTVAMILLKAMGAKNLSYIVPNRFEYGYGLSCAIVDLAAQQQPDLIITVDNGISSCDGVAHAASLGIDVVVTDHHLAGEQLPQACAIVNPNQPGDGFVSKNLAGVGVIFYVMAALRAHLQAEGYFEQQQIKAPRMVEVLDIVALGTVCDVVPLDQNNRILVKQGLARMRQGRLRPGIAALLQLAKRDHRFVTASDLGFGVGPRLNAAGRLDDMSLGIECLLAEDAATAQMYAEQLDQLNKERRHIEQDMQQQAYKVCDQLDLASETARAVALYEEDWHQGVVGLVASRVKERLHRPVIAFAPSDDGMLKGSGRSVPGLHLRDVLDEIATQHPDLIEKFGGHAMAAGLSIAQDDFEKFRQVFAECVAKYLSEEDLQARIVTDGGMMSDEFVVQTVHDIDQAGPWGQCFEEPQFCNELVVVEQRIVAEKHIKLRLQHPETEESFDAIWFFVNFKQWSVDFIGRASVVFRPAINRYAGMERLQLMVSHMFVVTV